MSKLADPKDIITRFVFYSKHIRKDDSIRPEAFIDDRFPEISIFQITDILNIPEQIWELTKYVRLDKEPKCRGDLLVENVENITAASEAEKIRVEIDGIPCCRHGIITFRPTQRAIDNLVAMKLANMANPVKK